MFWGDSHLHTFCSRDAGLVGGRLAPGDAYRFARGEEVTASMGVRVKLVRPLDWLVVADHAESLGVPMMLERADPRLLATEVGRATCDLWSEGDLYGAFEIWGLNLILAGQPIDAAYAERRARLEPLYEVTQMKGDGEAHPFLSPDDEFVDYENWDRGNWNSELKTPGMLPHEYARSALKLRLLLEQSLGVNPFKFGMVGATDSHTGLSSTRGDNYFGKVPLMQPSDDRFAASIVPDPGDTGVGTYEFETFASGLQGVWARENTRAALFNAMQRKQTYATTGSRSTVRVFAGWDFRPEEVMRPDFAQAGYARGVPMGGDMRAYSQAATPRLMIRALRDPDGANLDRVQVVKGWLDAEAGLQEVVIDAACSDDRVILDGRCERPVGNTVDVATASYTNDIGDALLMGDWEDPDFDPTERAFCYVRVVEIPTPRWTTHDAPFFGVNLPEGVPARQQDRAYTSPIW